MREVRESIPSEGIPLTEREAMKLNVVELQTVSRSDDGRRLGELLTVGADGLRPIYVADSDHAKHQPRLFGSKDAALAFLKLKANEAEFGSAIAYAIAYDDARKRERGVQS